MDKPAATTAQLSFEAMASKKTTDRLFFALFPDQEAAARISTLAQSLRGEHRLHGQALREDRLHVTLHHLGDYAGVPQDVVAQAGVAAARLAVAAFEASFDHVSSFSGRPGNCPLVLRGDQGLVPLLAMQRELGESMKIAGIGRWVKSGFIPHVTLLYDARSVAMQPVEPIAWTAREFVLVHSELGQTRHHVLGRWPLRA
ncbi:MAG: 2'-5' RNA ligase family protein [Luteimonas sp.]